MAQIGMQTGLEGLKRMHDTGVFRKLVLENGVSVWIQERSILTDEQGILVAVFSGVGSQMDPPDEHGLAHFYEHVPFRGTEDRPSGKELLGPIEKSGGSIGANTNQFRTTYRILSARDDLSLTAETLFQMISRPLIREEDVRVERGTIAEEHRLFYSKSDNFQMKLFLKAFFGEQHSLGHQTIGELSAIENMTREKLIRFGDNHYHAGNLHIICGGSFSWSDGILEKISNTFSQIRKGTPSSLPKFDPGLADRSGEMTVKNPEFKRDSLSLIIPMPLMPEIDFEAVSFLANILSNGFNSPLYIELREKRGWVYEDGLAYFSFAPDMNYFLFRCPTARDNFDGARDIFYGTLAGLSIDYMLARQRSRQSARKIAFSHPVSACSTAINSIVRIGRPISFSEEESIEDDLTIERIFYWRDYLLKKTPFVYEALA